MLLDKISRENLAPFNCYKTISVRNETNKKKSVLIDETQEI